MQTCRVAIADGAKRHATTPSRHHCAGFGAHTEVRSIEPMNGGAICRVDQHRTSSNGENDQKD
jgi:hypothetical protein